MSALGWYLVGLFTIPAIVAVVGVYLLASVLLERAGWFGGWRIYDPEMDPDRGYTPDSWRLDSWGPIHRGHWARVGSKWIGIGRRGGRGVMVGLARSAWRDEAA